MNNDFKNSSSPAAKSPDNTPEPRPKKIKVFIIFGIAVLFVIAALAGYFFSKQNKPDNLPSNDQAQINIETPKDNKQNKNTAFPALTEPKSPPFLKNIETDAAVKVDFHYDGDYTPQNDYFAGDYEYYTPAGTDEKFLSLSKVEDRENLDYGSQDYLSIFKSEESHSYQGTPIYITDANDKSSLAYLGFNINDTSLISELKVELGIDYNTAYSAGAGSKDSFIFSLLGVQAAYACGPGLYLRKVGESTLEFVQEADGILWYKLKTPIALYDLKLSYADEDCSTMPSYCKNQADDPPKCDKYYSCYYNASIPDLTKGNLRMHIYYKPNDKEGLLRLQVVNVILSNEATGTFRQTAMGEDFSRYYRAYLH
jgi:hypothetical protein